MDKKKLTRYALAWTAIALMIGIAGKLGEKEIIFPEMAALAIGLWIIDKRVWKVTGGQLIGLMTLGAVAGVCIVRYSPLPLACNIYLAFAFAAACLLLCRATLIPLISACVLPVLLNTGEWIYPLSVCTLSVILTGGRKLMERYGLRSAYPPIPSLVSRKNGIIRWLSMSAYLFLVSLLAIGTLNFYFIIPPLIVTFAEMVNSKAGFRNRPTQVFLFLGTAATLGTASQIIGHDYLHLPEFVIGAFVILCLFCIFEWTGKFFAPAGAMALIPMIVPREGLEWLPLQASIGAALFITIAMVVFQKCYRWSKAQLIYCITPTLLREYLNRKKRA